jgi:triacylglycerol esterase/lipase EstA (alpha/beta hydrolase family)
VRAHNKSLAAARIDTTRHDRYVPSVAMRIVAAWLGLWLTGCVSYIVVTYVHAFWHRRALVPLAVLIKAALRELLACALLLPFWPLWLIVGASYRIKHEGEPAPQRARPNPVILLHGFAMNRTNWIWLGRRLAARGIGPLYGTSYFSPQTVKRSAQQLARFIESVRQRERAQRVDIVAHSLGGTVARYYIERLGGAKHVHRLVTIGSPHHGTTLAHFGTLFPSARESRVDSPLYAEMGPVIAREGLMYTSIWSRADAIIEPPESASIVPAGEDRVFDDLGHLSLLLSARVIDTVAERLKA